MKYDIRKRHAVLLETPRNYTAQLGDTVVVDMKGYDLNATAPVGKHLNFKLRSEEVKEEEKLGEAVIGADGRPMLLEGQRLQVFIYLHLHM